MVERFLHTENVRGASPLSGTNCRKCASNKRLNFRKFEVSKDELTCLIENHSMLEIGRMFGVSDNAVRKRCKSLGVSTITKNSRKLIRLKAQIGS